MRPLLVLLIALTACGCGVERELSGEEIQALFREATVSGRHVRRDNYSFVSVYEGEQVTRTREDGRQMRGRWWTRGARHCVRWQSEGTDRCWPIVTDDAGGYEKVMRDRRGREHTAVDYDSFVGPDGVDRRVVQPWSRRAVESVVSFNGLVALLILLSLLFLLWRALLRGKQQPDSVYNTLRMHLGKLEAGVIRLSYRELVRASVADRAQFALEAVRDADSVTTGLTYLAMVEANGGDHEAGWAELWAAIEAHDDAALRTALTGPMQVTERGAPASFGGPRAAYVAAAACVDLCNDGEVRSARFAEMKEQACKLLEIARAEEPHEPPDFISKASYREPAKEASSDVDYAALAAPMYETALYLSPPVQVSAVSSSSSYAGGG